MDPVVLSATSVICGALLSWGVTHAYYRRAVSETPSWAKDLIAKFGTEQPSTKELMEYFNEAVAGGEIVPHSPSGYVMCPKCKAPSSELETNESQYPGRDASYVWIRCRKCGWTEHFSDL